MEVLSEGNFGFITLVFELGQVGEAVQTDQVIGVVGAQDVCVLGGTEVDRVNDGVGVGAGIGVEKASFCGWNVVFYRHN